ANDLAQLSLNFLVPHRWHMYLTVENYPQMVHVRSHYEPTGEIMHTEIPTTELSIGALTMNFRAKPFKDKCNSEVKHPDQIVIYNLYKQ
ncbi:unnamed protein product, partial [Prorocentrum cordatum]